MTARLGRRQVGLWDLRVIEIARLAMRRTAFGDPRKDRGFWWACYCDVCCKLRAAAIAEPF